MATTSNMRVVGADPARLHPGALLDKLARAIDLAAGAVSRALWIAAYERAEAIYWPKGKNK